MLVLALFIKITKSGNIWFSAFNSLNINSYALGSIVYKNHKIEKYHLVLLIH